LFEERVRFLKMLGKHHRGGALSRGGASTKRGGEGVYIERVRDKLLLQAHQKNVYSKKKKKKKKKKKTISEERILFRGKKERKTPSLCFKGIRLINSKERGCGQGRSPSFRGFEKN